MIRAYKLTKHQKHDEVTRSTMLMFFTNWRAKSVLLISGLVVLLLLTHSYLRNTIPIYNYLFPPTDLYEHSAEEDFDLSTTGFAKEINFTTKYPGNYVIALSVERPRIVPEKYDSAFTVKITIINDKHVLSEKVVSDSSFWFLGKANQGGFYLISYNVPTNLPINQIMTAKVEVIKASPSFREKYGKQHIYVSKISDE